MRKDKKEVDKRTEVDTTHIELIKLPIIYFEKDKKIVGVSVRRSFAANRI